MLGELTSKIKLHAAPQPMSVADALNTPRLVRKQMEVPLAMQGREPLLIGRDESLANLIIKDTFISRAHAAVFREENGDYFVQDLNSKNGTFLNDERLGAGEKSSRPLQNGDRIRFNIVEFYFIVPEEE